MKNLFTMGTDTFKDNILTVLSPQDTLLELSVIDPALLTPYLSYIYEDENLLPPLELALNICTNYFSRIGGLISNYPTPPPSFKGKETMWEYEIDKLTNFFAAENAGFYAELIDMLFLSALYATSATKDTCPTTIVAAWKKAGIDPETAEKYRQLISNWKEKCLAVLTRTEAIDDYIYQYIAYNPLSGELSEDPLSKRKSLKLDSHYDLLLLKILLSPAIYKNPFLSILSAPIKNKIPPVSFKKFLSLFEDFPFIKISDLTPDFLRESDYLLERLTNINLLYKFYDLVTPHQEFFQEEKTFLSFTKFIRILLLYPLPSARIKLLELCLSYGTTLHFSIIIDLLTQILLRQITISFPVMDCLCVSILYNACFREISEMSNILSSYFKDKNSPQYFNFNTNEKNLTLTFKCVNNTSNEEILSRNVIDPNNIWTSYISSLGNLTNMDSIQLLFYMRQQYPQFNTEIVDEITNKYFFENIPRF